MGTRLRQTKQQSTKSAAKRHHAKQASEPAKQTKKQVCITLLRRPKGATLEELQKATGWQPHSVRGFLSGTVKKAQQTKLSSETADDGTRRYRILEENKQA